MSKINKKNERTGLFLLQAKILLFDSFIFLHTPALFVHFLSPFVQL